MRVVVVGATGNVGTSILRSLEKDDSVSSVLGVARRLPNLRIPKVEWATSDVTEDDLGPRFEGADAVALVSWLIQPSRDRNKLWMTNVEGTMRAAKAAAQAGVPALVYASSVGTYSPGPKDRFVDEDWPTGGVAGSYYARQKAEVERRLDRFEVENPGMRVVRIRPGLVFKREASQGIRRLFGGPLLPGFLANPDIINLLPDIEGLRSQVVHSYDVGEAFRLALSKDVRGAFNLAADPPLDADEIGRILNAKTVRVPVGIVRAAADLSWRLRLQPVPSDWLDMSLQIPLMSTERARTQLGWRPEFSSEETLLDVLKGLRSGSGLDTPPLSPRTGGPARAREFATGVGRSEP